MRASIAALSLLIAATGCARSLELPGPPPAPGGLSLVLTANGAPLAGAIAHIASAGLASRTGADGVIRFGGLAEGSYTLEAASADGALSVTRAGVSIFAGKTTELGQVTLSTSGSLHGKASFGGAATGNAGIVLFLPLGASTALTADDGSFHFAGLAPGTYQVRAVAPGYQLATGASVEVQSGKDADAGALSLVAVTTPRLGSISGTVQRITALGPSTSGITVTLAGAGRAQLASAQGSYSLGGLPEGRYSVVLSAEGAQAVTLSQVAVSADAPTVLPAVLLRDATSADLDGDGIPDDEDPDLDGDGVPNAQDAFPRDPTEWADADGDGIGDNKDNCKTVYNPDQADLDHDGIGDACQPGKTGGGTNLPPSLSVTGRTAVNEGEQVALDVSGADPEGKPVTLTLVSGPAAAVFAANGAGKATYRWQTSSTDAGTYAATFRASDGALQAEASVQLVVAHLALLPTLHAPARLLATAGKPLSFTVTASHPSKPPALTVKGKPASATFTDDAQGTGTFAWTPDATDAAAGGVDLVFTATVTEGSASTATRIDVYPAANNPPSLTLTGPLAVDEGQTMTLALTATDPEHDPLALFATGLPLNAGFTDKGDGTGTFTFKPGFGQAGLYTVTFVASDGKAVTQQAAVLTVAHAVGNTPPTLVVAGTVHVVAGQPIDLTASASDPDVGQPLSLTVSGAPAAASFVAAGGSGLFHWATGPADQGTSNLTFSATDGKAVVQQAVALVVDKLEVAPVLAGPLANRSVSVGSTLTIDLSATDANLDPLAFSFTPSRAGASLNDKKDGTARFTLVPGSADYGQTLAFTFSVSDGSLSAQQSVQVFVPAQGNQPPIFDPVAAGQLIAEGAALTLNVRATDADLDPITLTGSSLPAGAVFTDNHDGTGRLVYTPGYGVSTGANVLVAVGLTGTDGRGGQGTLSIPITVTNTNRPPVIVHHADVAIGETASVILVTSASDPDGTALTYSFAISPGGLAATQATSTSSSTTVSTTYGSAGTYIVTATASDGVSQSSDTYGLVVQPAQVQQVRGPGGAAPVLGAGVLVLDQLHNQLVFYDPAKVPGDTVYFMALGTPATQKWVAKQFGVSGCAGPCFPPNGTTTTLAQGVVDQRRGALFVFRSSPSTNGSAGFTSPDTDVWRLDLTPGAEAWSQVAFTNPYIGGCGASDPVNKFRDGLFYNGANDTLSCEHLEGYTAQGAGFLLAGLTPVSHSLSGAAAAQVSSSYQWAWDAGPTKGWALLDDGAATAPRLSRVVEVTPGSPSSAVNLPASAVPAAAPGAGMAADTLGGRLFVFGGNSRSTFALVSQELYKFDLASGLWSAVVPNSPLPAARSAARMVFVPAQRLLYIGGGCSASDTVGHCTSGPLSDLWALDVSTSSTPPQANGPPVWDLVAGGLTVAEGQTLNLSLRATDPDGDAITLSASAPPANVVLTDNGNGTGQLVYQPSYAVSSGASVSVTVSLNATDARGAVTQLTLPITVTNTNRAPVINHHADLAIGETAAVTVTTSASDPDGSALTYGFSFASGSIALVQGTGAAANTATLTAPLGSAGTYKLTATASDGGLTATDTYNVVVQSAQLAQVANVGGAQPPLGSAGGTLALDALHNRLVFLDSFLAPDTVWLMALSTPGAQTWVAKTFPASGCGGPCYPVGGLAGTIVQSVVDQRRGALFLFRSNSNGQGVATDDDAWRLDLTPGAEAWTRLTAANPYTNGCGQSLPYGYRTALLYDAANDTIVCEHVTTQPTAGAGYLANAGQYFQHATNGLAAAAATNGAQWAWDSSQAKTWALVDDGTSAQLTRVVEITPGYPASAAVNLASNNTPPALPYGASVAVDTIASKLYVYGGRARVGGANATSDLYLFDLTSGLWSQLVPNSALPAPRNLAHLVFVPTQRLIYLAGGCAIADNYNRCSSGQINDLWTLDVSASAVAPAGNRAPAWDAVAGNLTVAEGSTLTLNVHATDADGDSLTLSSSGSVANAAFSDLGLGSGKLTYSPGYAVAAGNPVQVFIPLTATDAKGASTVLPVLVTVTNTNRAPGIVHHADVTVGEYSTFTVTTNASDPDGTPLTYAFSSAPVGLSVVQGLGAAASNATITAPPGSVGTYTISATASDGSAISTDTFQIVVQPGQVKPVPNAGGATPLLADGTLVLDQKFNQLVFYDAVRTPDTVYLMPLGNPATQTWTARQYPPSGCGGPCYPSSGQTPQQAQAVVDQQRGALFVFRNYQGTTALSDDVWRLDLNPATPLTAAWTRLSAANPFTNGCGAWLPGSLHTPLLYSSADDNIYCEHLGAQAASAAGWSAANRTLFAHATSGAGATAAVGGFSYSWDASNTKAWVLQDDNGSPLSQRLLELTPGAPSTAVIIPSTNPPPASLGAQLAVDPVLRRAFVFGGQARVGGAGSSDELFRFDLATGTWTQLVPNSPRPSARDSARMVYSPSQKVIYVGGGCSVVDAYGRCGGSTFSDLWVINVDPASGGL